jgi:hypothetical protein
MQNVRHSDGCMLLCGRPDPAIETADGASCVVGDPALTSL